MRKRIIDRVFKNLKIFSILIILCFLLGSNGVDENSNTPQPTAPKPDITSKNEFVKLDIWIDYSSIENIEGNNIYKGEIKIGLKNISIDDLNSPMIEFRTDFPCFKIGQDANNLHLLKKDENKKDMYIFKDYLRPTEKWKINETKYVTFYYSASIESYYKEVTIELIIQISHKENLIIEERCQFILSPESRTS